MIDYATHLKRVARWGPYLAETWAGEVPIRIHAPDVGLDGAPRWHPDFEQWLTREGRRHEQRRPDEQLRTTKVMRRLRRAAVREYEVLYRILVLRESVADTTRWLNERARANNIPLPAGRSEHYREKDTLALLIAGTEWALHHW